MFRYSWVYQGTGGGGGGNVYYFQGGMEASISFDGSIVSVATADEEIAIMTESKIIDMSTEGQDIVTARDGDVEIDN